MRALSFPALICRLSVLNTGNGLHKYNAAADYPSLDSREKEDCATSEDFIFLYEDFEGDRMLVGDVPWE